MPEETPIPATSSVDVGGVTFEVRISDDPSGLRGQVFYGEENIAGVQVFHLKSVEKLLDMARKDTAVLRAATRISG